MREETQRIQQERERQAIANDISRERLHEVLIRELPEIADNLPTPESLRIYGDGQANQLGHLLNSVSEAVEKFSSVGGATKQMD